MYKIEDSKAKNIQIYNLTEVEYDQLSYKQNHDIKQFNDTKL